jgi:hypothetical protein
MPDITRCRTRTAGGQARLVDPQEADLFMHGADDLPHDL